VEVPVESFAGVVVRAEQKLLGILAMSAGIEVPEPEQRLVQEFPVMGVRTAFVPWDNDREKVCAVRRHSPYPDAALVSALTQGIDLG
jgi:hypothetical protein